MIPCERKRERREANPNPMRPFWLCINSNFTPSLTCHHTIVHCPQVQNGRQYHTCQ